MSDSAAELWQRLSEAHRVLAGLRWQFLQLEDANETLRCALRSTDKSQRWAAIELCMTVGDEALHRAMFAEMVRMIAHAVPLFERLDTLVLEMDRPFVLANIDAIVAEHLQDWQGYSAVAWLYGRLGDPALIAAHDARCRAHPDPDIRELAADDVPA